MQLDFNCVRDLLLWLEENLQYSYDGTFTTVNQLSYTEAAESLGYEYEAILYTSQKLVEAGYITAYIDGSDFGVEICDYRSITYAGHEYLNAVRNNSIWKKIFSAVSASSNAVTLELIKELASILLKQNLTQMLGL